jgi:hypothetical protein
MAANFLKSIMAVASGFGLNTVTGASGGAANIDTTGATLFVAIIQTQFAGGAPTMTDKKNNTWQYGTLFNATGHPTAISIAYCFNPTTDTTHTFTPVGQAACSQVFAFSGAGTWSLESQNGATSQTSGQSVVTGTITPSVAGEVILAGLATNGSISTGTVNNGFNGGQGVAAGAALPQALSGSPEAGMGAYLVDSGTSPIGATFTTSANNSDWLWLVASFKLAPAGSTISGNAGISGAAVAYTGAASGSVTADSFGNYSITGLADGAYTVTPTLSGYTFTPASKSETVSGVNITGQNFSAGFSQAGYNFTVLGSDNAQRANENPLDPTKWTTATDGYTALQIISDAIAATVLDNATNNLQNFTEVAAGSNRFIQFKITTLDSPSDAFVSVGLYSDTTGDYGYYLSFGNNGDGTATAVITYFAPGIANDIYTNTSLPFVFGTDVVLFGVYNGILFFLQNGTQITSAQDTNLSSGFCSIDMAADNTAHAQVINVVVGSISVSGDVYDPTISFSGSVRVVGSAPSGQPSFLGTVKVLASAPAGIAAPYLGNVVVGTPSPLPNSGNPTLTQVVVVADAPAGAPDPYMGQVESA